MAMAAKADDVDPVNDAIEKYTDMHPAFEQARECKLIVALAAAWAEDDIDGFTDAIFKYDQITKLDNWTASILVSHVEYKYVSLSQWLSPTRTHVTSSFVRDLQLDVKKALKGETAGSAAVGDGDESDDDLDLS